MKIQKYEKYRIIKGQGCRSILRYTNPIFMKLNIYKEK